MGARGEAGHPPGRGEVGLLVALALLLLPSLGGELSAASGDMDALRAARPPAEAWQALGRADYEGFMGFCRRRIPSTAAVISIVAQPAFGYYRAGYTLYPRTVWPIVSPLGERANDAPVVTEARLIGVLNRMGARYLAVWHVALPRRLSPARWKAQYAPDEYVLALR